MEKYTSIYTAYDNTCRTCIFRWGECPRFRLFLRLVRRMNKAFHKIGSVILPVLSGYQFLLSPSEGILDMMYHIQEERKNKYCFMCDKSWLLHQIWFDAEDMSSPGTNHVISLGHGHVLGVPSSNVLAMLQEPRGPLLHRGCCTVWFWQRADIKARLGK